MHLAPGETIRSAPRYFRAGLWRVQLSITRTGWRRFNICKFYDKRPAIGAPWQFVRGTNYQVQRNPHF